MEQARAQAYEKYHQQAPEGSPSTSQQVFYLPVYVAIDRSNEGLPAVRAVRRWGHVSAAACHAAMLQGVVRGSRS
jgi:hypothetical protein